MSLLDAIHGRRTIHAYTQAPVPGDVLDRALSAAHQAPCHKQTWPWRFHVVGPALRAQITELVVAFKGESCGGLSPEAERAARAKVGNPGALVIVTRIPHDDAFRAREDYAAVACAVQNAMLSLHTDGFGSKWGTGAVTRDPRVLQLLGLPEGSEVVEGFLWIGEPKVVPTVSRPDVSDVVVRHD